MNYRNPVSNRHGTIDCEIEHPVYGWIPFTCDPSDIGAAFDTAELFLTMTPKAAPYVAPPPPTQAEIDEATAQAVRAERDMKLSKEVDPIASNTLRWEELGAEAKISISAYRLALLDVPQQDGFPNDVVWPTKPT